MFVIGTSALEFWRLRRMQHPHAPMAGLPYARVSAVDAVAPPDAFVVSACKDPLAGLSLPVHVAVAAPQGRRTSRLKTCRVVGTPLTSRTFVRVEPRLFVAAPELAYVQVAAELSPVEAIWLGFELCGSYALDAANYNLAPLTSVDRLATQLARLRGVVPTARLARVQRQLVHIKNDSASPAETQLAMLYALPRAWGGMGFAHPVLNCVVTPTKRQAAGVAQPSFRCDLFWPHARVGVEYDSDAFHTGAERIARDAARRNALEYVGVTVVVVTKDQLYDAGAFCRTAEQLAAHLGVRLRLRDRSYDWGARYHDLRSQLLYRDSV